MHIELLDETATGGGRHRFVTQVLEVNGLGEHNRPTTTLVFGPGTDGRAVPLHRPDCLPDLTRAGFDERLLDNRYGTWDLTPTGGAR